MVFTSSIFTFLFLPLVILLYFVSPKKIKNYVLLIFSLIFYLFGGPKYILLLLSIVTINYVGALLIDKLKNKKMILITTLILDLSILFYFKYIDFFIKNINGIFNIKIPYLNVILPIGISFYTFQAIGYLIDVYKKEVSVQKNYFNLLLYVSFFPQLVAGPIVRYKTIEKEINNRKVSITDVSYGIERFILGFAKKLIIANQVGFLANIIFTSKELTMPVAWLGAISYTLQIYFDFSAYSDMAIGMGRIFGFHFLENFNFPYISKSITEFWRRWHISLSSFFKDYVYIPLGGNRVKKTRWIFNLLVVWLLTGLWHGASWNFVLWGLYYFIFLIVEKIFLKKYLDKSNIISRIYTLIIIVIGWTLFNSVNLSNFSFMIKNMFSLKIGDLNTLQIYIETYWVYLIGGFIFSTPIYYYINDKLKKYNWFILLKYIGLLLLFIVAIMFIAKSTYNPFIYFRF